ncbi:hypothetical protein [Abyssisolibacter fermentans]|uniref:DUF7916 family protein n=1 Tax=Abyssisolibacter fermentans TaxID=1766203 RepID=UPI00082A503C|nr:hypothetical protein [Abyssisolibacter fermentans]
MKRIFELNHNDVTTFSKKELIKTIKKSEGRTIMCETVISSQSMVYGVSNPELAASFGADMITLNTFDFNMPFVFGLEDFDIVDENVASSYIKLGKQIKANSTNNDYIRNLKNILGRFVGVNMEPVPEGFLYPKGLQLNEENLKKAIKLGFDYIVITGNPNTGVTINTIVEGIKKAVDILGDRVMIIAGKMHGAGRENVYDPQILKDFANAGADVVMIPAPGTVPGMDQDLAKRQIEVIHEAGALAKTAMGTSQESASINVIEKIGLMSKMAGADVIHIGDAGHCGIADPENIMALSIAIRGKRHTYRRMSYSIRK